MAENQFIRKHQSHFSDMMCYSMYPGEKSYMSKNRFWRYIALGCAAYISAFFGLASFAVPLSLRTYYFQALIPLGIFMLYSIIHEMRFPLDLRLYVIWVIIFSGLALAWGSSAEAVLLFYCAWFLGKRIHWFKTHLPRKCILISIFLACCLACQLRLEKQELINSIMELIISGSAILTMNLICKKVLQRIEHDLFETEMKEDIHSYFNEDSFTERDKQMLEEVFAGCKYEEIAINHQLSLSSVKKRLAFLYKKLGVTCQIDFIIKFAPAAENSTKV